MNYFILLREQLVTVVLLVLLELEVLMEMLDAPESPVFLEQE